METILLPLITGVLQYVYGEYILAVIVVTELIKKGLEAPKIIIHPKWITLVVAILLGVGEFFWKGDALDWHMLIVSFGVSTIGYDYFIKPLLDWVKSLKKKDA